jgi:hypothetical protein
MVVVFYKTTATGQAVAGHIFYDGETLRPVGALATGLLETLMEGVDRSVPAQVEKALRAAPQRFDGSYMRAAFEEDDDKATLEDALIAQALKEDRSVQFGPKESD